MLNTNFSPRSKFFFAVGIQVLILLTVIIYKLTILSGGAAVFLRIEPVDPRDPLRGDYVTFRYSNISSISSYYFENESISNGETIYVSLEKSGKYWTIEKASRKKPTEGIFLKGKVVSGGKEGHVNSLTPQANRARNLQVEYGIENYFIPEGTGTNFNFTSRNAGAVVMIDENGSAVLKQLYIDDEPWP